MWNEAILTRIAASLVGALIGALMAYALHQSLHPRPVGALTLGQSLQDTVNLNTNPIVIRQSLGGRIDAFAEEIGHIIATRQTVILDGFCASACTMVLRVRNLCATDRALLGFHEAWVPGPGGHIVNPEGTREMAAFWRPYVFTWLRRVGGITPDIKVMGPADIYRMVPRCAG